MATGESKGAQDRDPAAVIITRLVGLPQGDS